MTPPQRRLRAAEENLSAHSALRVPATVRLVEFEAVDSRRKRVVTKGTKQERKALNALKIPRMQPPRVLAQASGTEQGMNVVIIRKRTSL